MATEDSKVTTEYALASKGNDTAVVDGVTVDDDAKEYGFQNIKAHKCCGGCCDMRRAVITVNIINASLLALGLMSFVYSSTYDYEDVDDDEVKDAYTSLDTGMGGLIAITAVKLVLSLVGIYGAYTYNVVMVGISCACYFLEAVFAFVFFNIGGLVYASLFAYPHFFFIREARAGVMTKENYHNVEHSCCCV